MNCFVSFMVFISVRKSMLLTSFHAVSFSTLVAFVILLVLIAVIAAVAVSYFPLRMPPRIITVFPLTLCVPARCFILPFYFYFLHQKYNSLALFCFIFSDYKFLKFFYSNKIAFFSLLNNSFFFCLFFLLLSFFIEFYSQKN